MNRSNAAKKSSPAPAPAPANKKKKKKDQSPRNPLQDVNVIGSEAPRGCLRFFLSSSNFKTPIRTMPKSKCHVSKPKSTLHHSISISSSSDVKSGSSHEISSPLLCKTPTGLGKVDKIDNSSKRDSTTPPVQASVSPEIHQFGSSALSSASLACYAAGHVLSGISDKRKCRPRGILNVGLADNDSAFGFHQLEEIVRDPDASMLPLPTQASMHWLLSPCTEEDEDHKDHSETSTPDPAKSPSHCREFSSDVCCGSNLESTTCPSRRNTFVSPSGLPKEPLNEHMPVLSSPRSTPGCQALPLRDESQCIYDFDAKNSPFSMASLDSGNVILTPQSDSSADRHAGLSCSNAAELSSVAEAIRMVSLSPNCHQVIEDQIDSSFQFDCLTTTCNSISRIQKMLDDQAPWHSTSTSENVSQSQLRISWRERLMSRMYDMDEYDCCRCLSDEEEDINACSNDLPKKSCRSPEVTNNVGGDQILPDASWSADLLDEEPGVAGKGKEDCPPKSCAESISTDGGGLLASGDSDWNLCYKNELFHV